jgi:4-hydroxy-L-threonine phosphate dehydrogenase PdxA
VRIELRSGIKIGDPAGIGPEVSLEAVAGKSVLAACSPFIGGAQCLSHWSRVSSRNRGFDCVSNDYQLNAPITYHLVESCRKNDRENALCAVAHNAFSRSAFTGILPDCRRVTADGAGAING